MTESRAGSQVELNAIILGQQLFGEAHKIVWLCTLEQGKISAMAMNAARSTRRFGAALQAGNFVRAYFKAPRELSHSETLWALEKLDIRADFAHLRSDYSLLESAFFALRFVQDIVPADSGDPSVFKALGRFLRDSQAYPYRKGCSLLRIAFWSWMAHHFGFGDLTRELETTLKKLGDGVVSCWHHHLAQAEPNFLGLFEQLESRNIETIQLADEVAIYKRWVSLSGVHWEHFEKWLISKNYSLS